MVAPFVRHSVRSAERYEIEANTFGVRRGRYWPLSYEKIVMDLELMLELLARERFSVLCSCQSCCAVEARCGSRGHSRDGKISKFHQETRRLRSHPLAVS